TGRRGDTQASWPPPVADVRPAALHSARDPRLGDTLSIRAPLSSAVPARQAVRLRSRSVAQTEYGHGRGINSIIELIVDDARHGGASSEVHHAGSRTRRRP